MPDAPHSPDSVASAGIMEENSLLPDSALQRIVESLNQDLEEKIHQLSQVRQVAEAVSRGIHEAHYFPQVCADFIETFDAAVCCLFWQRIREPRGWWLDAWATRPTAMHPTLKQIPAPDEGLFTWIKKLQKPHYLESAAGQPFLTMWTPPLPENIPAAIIPLTADDPRIGMLVLIDPNFKQAPRNIQLQLEILASLINSGIHNRLLYHGLQESEEEFRDLVENSSDMVVVVYPDGIIRECNTLLKRKLSLSVNPQGRNLAELVTEGEGHRFTECWGRLLSGDDVDNVDVNLKKEDGGLLEVELSGNIRPLPDGHPGLIRLYLRDLTERREAKRRQRELELELELARERQLAQVGLYVSGIAHNLQNPVQVLLGYLELLKLKGVKIPEFNIIEQSTLSIMNIIRNLLDKMQKERNPEATDVDLNGLLDSELTFLNANNFFKHEILKKYQYDSDLPTVKGVYSDFSQALMNIIYNALDAMRESSVKELKIRTNYNPDQNLITVNITDTGSGIPKELAAEIFKPFFTTKKSRVTGMGLSSGTGLGLSSSAALLKPYGGKITFESDLGKGTTFKVAIPLQPPEDGER
jgi:PAS domain S-box-containing protein